MGRGKNYALGLFYPTRWYEVYLDTDCKINAKCLENIFQKTIPPAPQNHACPHSKLHPPSHLKPQIRPLTTLKFLTTNLTTLLQIQKSSFYTPNFLPFYKAATFPHPLPPAKPHSFPTYPQLFPQPQIQIDQSQVKSHINSVFRNTTFQNYFGFPKWFTTTTNPYLKPNILKYVLTDPIY